MSKDRTEAWKAYDALYNEAAANYAEGRQIVIVAEGDAGFYSSIQYIYDKFIETGIDVQRIAGIPAFIAAGALAGCTLSNRKNRSSLFPALLPRKNYLKR